MVSLVSPDTVHTPAKVLTVSRESPAASLGGSGARLRCPWAAAGPGRTTSRRAERSSRRGRLAGGPSAHEHTKQPGPPKHCGARNTSGAKALRRRTRAYKKPTSGLDVGLWWPSVSSMRKKSSRCYSAWPPWTEGSTRNPYLQYRTNRNGKLGHNTIKHQPGQSKTKYATYIPLAR